MDLSRFDPRMRRLVSGILLASAAVLSKVAAQRLELLHKRPGNALPYFLEFGLTVLLALAAGLVAPAPPADTADGQAASALTGRVRSLWYAAAIGTVVLFGWAWIRQGRSERPLLTLAVWSSALALGTVAFVFAGRRRIVRDRRERLSPGIVVALLLVLIAAACARLIGLEAVPPVFGGDEAGQVMDGTSLIHDDLNADPFGTGWIGTGRLGMLPAGAGGLLWKDPVAGPRLLYAMAGALSVVACAAAAGLVAGGWGALGCAALLAFSPFHVHFSRLAAVFILDALLAALAVLFLLAAHRSGSPVCGYLAGVSAGLSLYGYAGGRVIAVSFLVALPLLFFLSPASGGKRRWLLFSAVTGFALTAAPGLRFAFQHSDDWNARLNEVGIFNSAWWGSQVSLLSSARVIGDQFLAGTIGLLSQHTYSAWYLGYPILAPIVFPALALAGLGWMLGRRQFFPVALLALIAAGNLANLMLTVAAPTPQRASSLVPILAILGGVAIAGFLESVPSRDAEGIPWRGTVGALLIGGLLARTYGGPPRFWDPSPGYGGPHAAFVQSAYKTLQSERYRGESVFLHGRPYLDSSFPNFHYLLPQIHWVDLETRERERLPPAPGLHLFSPEWLPAARQWRARFRIPFGIALPDPGDPLHDIGYLFRAVSRPAKRIPPRPPRGPKRLTSPSRTPPASRS